MLGGDYGNEKLKKATRVRGFGVRETLELIVLPDRFHQHEQVV